SINQLKLLNFNNLENISTLRELIRVWSQICRELQEKNDQIQEQLQLNQDEKQTMFNAYYSLCNYIQHIKEKLINVNYDTVQNELTYDQFESTFQLNETVNRLNYENQQLKQDIIKQTSIHQQQQPQTIIPSDVNDFVLTSIPKPNLLDTSIQTDSIEDNKNESIELINRLHQLNSQIENELDFVPLQQVDQHPLDKIEFLFHHLKSQLFSEISRCEQYAQANNQWQTYFEKNYAQEFQTKFGHLLPFEQGLIDEHLTLEQFVDKLLNIIQQNDIRSKQRVREMFDDVVQFNDLNEDALEQQLQTIKQQFEYYKQKSIQPMSSDAVIKDQQMPPIEERLQTVALQTKENDEQTSKLEKALDLLKIETSKLKSSQDEIEQLKSDHQQQSESLTNINDQLLRMTLDTELLHSDNLALIEKKHQLEMQLDQMNEQYTSIININKYNEIVIEQLKFTVEEQQKIKLNVRDEETQTTMAEQNDIALQISVDTDDHQSQTEFIKKENNNHYTQTDITKLQSTECQSNLMIDTNDQETQTQLVNQLWTL
ncbi:unnamed protein product, partial [Didymodactylos carnosus]